MENPTETYVKNLASAHIRINNLNQNRDQLELVRERRMYFL